MNTQNYSINLDMFDGEAFCRAACWYDLVTLSSDKAHKILWLGKPLMLKPFQVATTIKLLADRWNMTAQTARTRLKEFAAANIIMMERIGSALVITLLNPSEDKPEVEPEVEHKVEPEQQAEVQAIEVEPKLAEPVGHIEVIEPVEVIESVEVVEVAEPVEVMRIAEPQRHRLRLVAPPQLCNSKSKACERAKMKLRQCRLSASKK
jgi:hypothetical protein